MDNWLIEGYNQQDVEDLAAFTSLDPATCMCRLEAYELKEMADSWQRANPANPDEIREFYQSTDLYIWELTKWHNSTDYTPYLELLDTLIERYPPSQFPQALDYGSGIGTVAMRLIQAGYQVTIADVPGTTLDYAEFRLRRRGYEFDVVRVVDTRPRLPQMYDVILSFDVLEHIPQPDRLIRHLTNSLRSGGVAALVETIYLHETHPHHLVENVELFSGLWPLILNSCGLDPIAAYLYRKTSKRNTAFRQIRYWLWRATGLYIVHSRDLDYMRGIVT